METSGWVSVRCVVRLGGAGSQMYEERITLWRADDTDTAIARAEIEARAYAADLGDAEYVGLAQAYLLFDEPGDGAEVFSLIRSDDRNPDAYLDRFFDTGRERQTRSD